MFLLPFLLLSLLPFAAAAAIIPPPSKRLPSAWHHADDHPVHALFRRDPPTTFVPVGSPTWANGFPPGVPDPTQLPPQWINAYNAAMAAGKIPNIPVATQNAPATTPIYPGADAGSATICSASYGCRSPADVWDGPDGHFLTSFDDGPLPPTAALRQFMDQNDETTTHFFIGTNILFNPTIFQSVYAAGDDIAVHTWTHPYMTTLSNLDVVGQLGWTAQLIYNSTDGRVPKYWRPPYGDVDNRVRAIASEVFGLTTVIWNHDTGDWAMASPGGPTPPAVAASFQQWLTGPKSPGLIILEHELSDLSVQAFIAAYPVIKANGWTMGSLAQVISGGQSYQNSKNSSAPILPAQVGPSGSGTPTPTTPTLTTTTPISSTGISFGASASPSSGALSRGDVRWSIWVSFVLATFFC